MALISTYLQPGSVYIFGEPVATSSGHNKCFVRVHLQSVRQHAALTTLIYVILHSGLSQDKLLR